MKSKKDIRESIFKKRNSLDKETIKKLSQKIINRLYEQDEYKNSKKIMFYASYKSEVHTLDAIKKSIDDGKDVCIPVVKGKDLIISKIESFNELDTKNQWGIPEPSVIRETDVNKMDLIVVPIVVFDKARHRIGYGWGGYDRMLKEYNGFKIGLAFSFQEDDKIPAQEHDVRLDKIITETTII